MSTAISMRIYNTPTQSVTVYGKMYKLLEMSEKPTEKSPREINYTCNRNIKNIIYFASVCTLTRTHGEWISLLGRVNWETERLQNETQLVQQQHEKSFFMCLHIMPKTNQTKKKMTYMIYSYRSAGGTVCQHVYS